MLLTLNQLQNRQPQKKNHEKYNTYPPDNDDLLFLCIDKLILF
jgi:hypothetical protein